MKKVLVFLFILILLIGSLSIILAVSNNGNGQGDNSQKNNIQAVDNSEDDDNEAEVGDNNDENTCLEKGEMCGDIAGIICCDKLKCDNGSCIKKSRLTNSKIKEIIKEKNRIKFEERTGQECPENCTCTGVVIKCVLEDGSREMTVYAQSGNRIVIVKGVNMTTNVTLYHHNKIVYGVFKNNETKEIILPDKVKEKIKAKIKAKLENHNITLTEDGIYIVQMNKRARLFFLFPVNEKINADVDAEDGVIIKIRNPWWGFLAKDVAEEESE